MRSDYVLLCKQIPLRPSRDSCCACHYGENATVWTPTGSSRKYFIRCDTCSMVEHVGTIIRSQPLFSKGSSREGKLRYDCSQLVDWLGRPLPQSDRVMQRGPCLPLPRKGFHRSTGNKIEKGDINEISTSFGTRETAVSPLERQISG